MITRQHRADGVTCSQFRVCTPPEPLPTGIVVIELTDRYTGELRYLQIDVMAEILSIQFNSANAGILLNLLANKGFLVTPTSQALDDLFYLLVWAHWEQHRQSVPVIDLPTGVTVEIVSITSEETPHAKRQH